MFKQIIIQLLGLIIVSSGTTSRFQDKIHPAAESSFRLQQVIIHTRHGARAPMYDVLSSYPYWLQNYAPEELTTVGQRQHFLLGTSLKSKYRDILPQYFDETLIQVYSTQSPRAVRSAQSFMLGLYPKSPQFKIIKTEKIDLSLPPGYQDKKLIDILINLGNKSLPHDHQTFPQIAPIDSTDSILSPENVCPKIDRLRNLSFRDQKYKIFEDDLQKTGFYERFETTFKIELARKGIVRKTVDDYSSLNMTVVGWFYDSLVCDQFESMEMPKELDDHLMKEMLFIYDVQNLWKNFPSDEAIKLLASQQARYILSQIDQLIQGSSSRKLILLSGHDGDVNTMLQFLCLQESTFNFNQHEAHNQNITYTNAPFTSSLIFELYKNIEDNQFSVQTIYNGHVQLLQFCDIPSMCSLDNFRTYILDNTYSEDQWTYQCKI